MRNANTYIQISQYVFVKMAQYISVMYAYAMSIMTNYVPNVHGDISPSLMVLLESRRCKDIKYDILSASLEHHTKTETKTT